MKKKFTVLFNNSICFGVMEILSIDKFHNTAYVNWSISDAEKKPVAGVANNYFLGKDEFSLEEIFNLVIIQIPKYRIGRKKVFSNVQFEL